MAIAAQSPPVTPLEARRLLEISSRRTSTGRRNRALVAILWRVGLRPGEALSIGIDDVDVNAGTVSVGDRIAGLDALATQEISAWAERREELQLDPSGPLISTLRGKPLSQAYVRELLPRLAEKAGLGMRVHAMGLRYACAAELSGEGVLTEVIETQLGIRSQSSVAQYLPHPDAAETVAAMRGRTLPVRA